MKQRLNQKQIEYVLFHLKQHVSIDELEAYFAFGEEGQKKQEINFPLSDNEINPLLIKFESDHIPVLFPMDNTDVCFSFNNGKLLFHHDFLKSAFYLLSSYQEWNSSHSDFMGRFQYKGSIQEKLDFVTKPLVNYYFDIIIQGFEQFAKGNGLLIRKKRLFDRFGFMLTHDVDRIDYYHWRETIYKWLQVFGLKPAHYHKKRLLKAAVDSLLPTFFPGYKVNPWWNFKELRKLEKNQGLKSVWYFLNRDGSPHDAKYHLEEKRIRDLVADLQRQGCEVGLHGSIKTADNAQMMKTALDRLKKITNNVVVGARQHFLKFRYPQTLQIQQFVGLHYDTTMGFAEHEGFRNSYCYPFRPYDHEKDQMMEIWEFPLAAMDTTLFGYRRLEYTEIKESVENIITEVSRFGGLFVLLWHNCNFDEYQYPGITDYYKSLLVNIAGRQPQSLTGANVLDLLSSAIIAGNH